MRLFCRCFNKSCVYCLLLISGSLHLYAQAPDTVWTKTYGGVYWDEGLDVQQTIDGGYIVTGFTSSFGVGGKDIYLIRTDSNGDTLWTKTYGGTGDDIGFSVRQTSDGGYIITGEIFVPGNHMDLCLLKTDSQGATLWVKTYGGPDPEVGRSVRQTFDGGYIITGDKGYVTYCVKTNATGDTIWTRTYGEGRGYEIEQTSDGGYIIAGVIPVGAAGDALLLRIDTLGNTLWSKSYGGTYEDFASAVTATADGYIAAGGRYYSPGGYDVYLIRTDTNGDTIWTGTIGGPNIDYGKSIQKTADDRYIIAGITGSFGAGNDDVYLIRADSYGNTIWSTTYGGPDHDRSDAVDISEDGGYIIAGCTKSSGAGSMDVWVLKTNPLKLLVPDGGETWPGGTTVDVTWWCENNSGMSYRILLSINGGASYTDTIATGIAADSTHWHWSLPAMINTMCRVRVQLLDSLGAILCDDASNGNFSILGSTPPTPFSLISPADSALLPVPRPTFVWQRSFGTASGLSHYDIYINDTLIHSCADTIWTAEYDLTEGFNNWFIIAYDSIGNARQSNETFTLLVDITPPTPVSLIAPADNSYMNDNAVDFVWHAANDNFSGIDHYFFQHALDSIFSQSVVETTLIDTMLSTYLLEGKYHWHVKARDVAGNWGAFSPAWNLEVDTLAPSGPMLISPINGVMIEDTLVNFKWTEVTNFLSVKEHNRSENRDRLKMTHDIMRSPIRYIVQMDTVLNFSTPILVDTLDTTSVILSIYENHPYYWRVRAYDLAGNQGVFGNPDSFGVDVAPVIESTTVWDDTSYTGPFEIIAKVTDNVSGVNSAVLFYQRVEDSTWLSSMMTLSTAPNWFVDTIPKVDTLCPNDTVKYYIEATDNAGHTCTDPLGAPASHYSFVANCSTGVCEAPIESEPIFFDLLCNPVRDQATFRFSLQRDAVISLHIYDVCGRLVDRPARDKRAAGSHEIIWIPLKCVGVYFYVLETPYQKEIGKLIVIR